MKNNSSILFGRIINSIFSGIECFVMKEILQSGLLECLLNRPEIDNIIKRYEGQEELIYYYLAFLECIKLIKKTEAKYSIMGEAPIERNPDDRIRLIYENIMIDIDEKILYTLLSFIIAYNEQSLYKYHKYFTDQKWKKIGMKILSCEEHGNFEDFHYYRDISKYDDHNIIDIVKNCKRLHCPFILGGYTISKKKKGPKHSILLKILSLKNNYRISFDNIKLIKRFAKKEEILFREIKLKYAFAYIILNPRDDSS